MVISEQGRLAMFMVQLDNWKTHRDSLKESLKKLVVDKTFPLEERWKAFVTSELGNDEPYTQHFKGLSEECNYYGDLYIEKYQTVNTADLFDIYLERNEDVEDGEKFKLDEVAYKEDVLSRFIKSFKFNW